MREIVCINIGQAGIQMANAGWELFCIEHGINADGRKRNETDEDSHAFTTFFQKSPNDQYVPRCLSIDLEPSVVDEVRTGPYRQLFHPDSLITGEEDAASNFARGHFTIGKQMIDDVMNKLRRVADNCEWLEGFVLMSSYGGGTGSGFDTLVMEKLCYEFAKRMKLSVVVYPCAKLSTSTVEPYNALLTTHFTMEQGDMSIYFDNQSCFDICFKSLNVTRPTYSNLNRLIAQIYSSITVSLRYESSLNATLDQMVTNLIPYPRIHYLMLNHAPILSKSRATHENFSALDTTRALFDCSNQLLDVDVQDSKYMSCCLQYRGAITPREVNSAVYEIKKRSDVKFVEWCPTGFKVGINSQPPTAVPSSGIADTILSASMISNNSAIKQIFERTTDKFNSLFSKRSFVHWYVGEGMEEGEFNEARDNCQFLVKDYGEVTASENDEEDDDEEPDHGKSGLSPERTDGNVYSPPIESTDANYDDEQKQYLNESEANKDENYQQPEEVLNYDELHTPDKIEYETNEIPEVYDQYDQY